MAQIRTNAQNSLQNLNQIQSIGNPNPPNMNNISQSLLQAANPAGSSILSETRVDLSTANRSAESCRVYTDVEGLRRLQQDQLNNTYYDSGCGWRYKASAGLVPEISQAALGSARGPSFAVTEADTMNGGVSWAWGTTQLQETEKKMSSRICSTASQCKSMAFLGKYQNICGFCKTSGTMIPIEKQGGRAKARFANDPTLSCMPQNIITSAEQCPSTQEGFVSQSLDELGNCASPLSRDCVVLAARAAGCSDKGSMIAALTAAPNSGDYDAILKQNKAFQTYRQSANPSLTPAVFKDGSAGVNTALSDFEGIVRNMQSSVPKLRLASKDLCVKGGEFDTYDFCSELGPTTVISQDTLACAQKRWLEQGGTRAGKGFPTLNRWQGRTFSALDAHIANLKRRLEGFTEGFAEGFTDGMQRKLQQEVAMNELVGTNANFKDTIDVPRNDLTRGIEAVLFSIVSTPLGTLPIILGSDARLASKVDMVFPTWSNAGSLPAAGFPSSGPMLIAMMTAFEVRPAAPTTIAFQVEKTGGFALAQNKNPFERMNATGNDWGSWSNGTATITSGDYQVSAEGPNIFMSKVYGTAANTRFLLRTKMGNLGFVDPNATKANTQDFYLTQSALAPYVQYEICDRANGTEGAKKGFFDTRWTGPCALHEGKSVPGFDVKSNGCVVQTRADLLRESPVGKPYLSLTTGSWWKTDAYFAYTAFKTLTIAVRPTGAVAPGQRLSIFQHANFAGYSHGIYLRNVNGAHVFEFENRFDGQGSISRKRLQVPAELQKWNLIVVQYLKDAANQGVADIHMEANTFENLRVNSVRRAFLSNLQTAQGRSLGALLLQNAAMNPSHSGLLALGGTMSEYKTQNGLRRFMDQSFTGDVAWVHGFRNYLDTEEQLKNELVQEWERRWAIPLNAGEPLPQDKEKRPAPWREAPPMAPPTSQQFRAQAQQIRRQVFSQFSRFRR